MSRHPAWARDVNGYNVLGVVIFGALLLMIDLPPAGSLTLNEAGRKKLLIALLIYALLPAVYFGTRIWHDVWCYRRVRRLLGDKAAFEAALQDSGLNNWLVYTDNIDVHNQLSTGGLSALDPTLQLRLARLVVKWQAQQQRQSLIDGIKTALSLLIPLKLHALVDLLRKRP